MPSEYPTKQEMERRRREDPVFSDLERLHATGSVEPTRHRATAQIVRLANRLGVDADELAKKIPADTLRRTRFPMIEEKLPDGRRTFKDDPGIHEGVRGLILR